MYEPYDKETASLKDNAPMNWTRYRAAACFITSNKEVMANLNELAKQQKGRFKFE